MSGFDEAIIPAIVMVGFGLAALIMSKAGSKNGSKKTHRRRSHRS